MTAVSCDKFLLSSEKKNKLVLFDSKTDKVLSEIVLQNQPRLICMIDSQQAATTLNNKKIQFIKVKDTTLINDGVLDVDVDVRGIATYNNDIVVSSYPPAGVKIISKDGAVIHKLDTTAAGGKVFKNPRWIATTSDDFIFVTDWGTNKITRLDSRLSILQTFAWPMLDGPCGILSLNKDQLLVCNMAQDNIVVIEPNNNTMAVILEKQHGVDGPSSICFCNEQKKLYVAPGFDTPTILVYKLV